MYKQSMDHIRTIIIPIDSLIFDLNQYRYHYYKDICLKKNNKELSIDEFHQCIGSIASICSSLNLDINDCKEVERTLYNRFKYEYLKPKDGVMEILHYAKTKNIHIAVLSPYDKEYISEYIKKAHFSDKIEYIVTPNDSLRDLPYTDMIEDVMEYFNTSKEETLVLSSYSDLSKAANDAFVNVIYVKDLVYFDNNSNGLYYSVCRDLYAVLNLLLFEKYEEYQMFSDLLGMNSHMTKEELIHRKESLYNDFKDESHVLSVIDHTFGYHISQLNEHSVKEPVRQFTFNDAEPINESNEVVEEVNETEVKEEVIVSDIKEEATEDSNGNEVSYTSLSDKEGQELSQLINEIESSDENSVNDGETETVEVKKKKKNLFVVFIKGLISTLFTSIALLIFCILFYILFNRDLSTVPSLAFIPEAVSTYIYYIELCVTWIFDQLHALYPDIMTYSEFLSKTTLSEDLVLLINIFSANTLIIGIFKMLVYMLFKRKNDYVK